MDTRLSVPNTLTAVAETDAETSHIVLEGRLDRDGEAALSAAYDAATAADPSVVEIDFGGVDYINSTGIALVVRLLADARRDGRAIRARGLSEHYREIFTITRLSDFMTIVDEEEVEQA
jgi:anti-sigma B factor antagonist